MASIGNGDSGVTKAANSVVIYLICAGIVAVFGVLWLLNGNIATLSERVNSQGDSIKDLRGDVGQLRSQVWTIQQQDNRENHAGRQRGTRDD
jgi:hypothetical protein